MGLYSTTKHMKQDRYDSLGLDVQVQLPETVEEFDSLAGKVGACLQEACDNVVYRGVLAQFRSAFVNEVEKQPGAPTQLRQQKKDQKGNLQFETVKVDGVDTQVPLMEVTETEGKYINRVKAEMNLTDEDYVARFQPIANSVASGIKFDPKASERKPKTPPKTYLEAADSIIAKGGTFERASEKLSTKLGYPVPATRDGIAFAIQEDQRRQRETMAAELV